MVKKRFSPGKAVLISIEVLALIAVNVVSYVVLKKMSDSHKSNTLLAASAPGAEQASVNWSFILPVLIPSVCVLGFTILLLFAISRMKRLRDLKSKVLAIVSGILILCSIIAGIWLFRYQQKAVDAVAPIQTHQAG